ncbi:MAG: helix-turn-helix domain-containing protein [Thermomicrobiales bacterium]
MEKIAYSIAEAARVAGIGRTKLYELINAGELPLIKVGSRSLVRRVDVEALLDRNTVRSIAA